MLELNVAAGFGTEFRIFADEPFLAVWLISSVGPSLLISWYFTGGELRLMWLGARWWFSPFGLCRCNRKFVLQSQEFNCFVVDFAGFYINCVLKRHWKFVVYLCGTVDPSMFRGCKWRDFGCFFNGEAAV